MGSKTEQTKSSWAALEAAEQVAFASILQQLSSATEAVKLCYELGVDVGFLLAEVGEQSQHTVLSGLLLKRILTDLRTIWLLCVKGYTSQAGVLCASLYENALTTEVVAGSDERTTKVMLAPGGGQPWSVKTLAELAARRMVEAPHKEEGGKSVEEERDFIYFSYRWLCKLKHPTIPSLLYEAGATQTGVHRFAVAAMPDVAQRDACNKGMILCSAISRTCYAIEAILDACQPNESAVTGAADLEARTSALREQLGECLDEYTKGSPAFLLDPSTHDVKAYGDRLAKEP
jgi:hypothetical protein